MSMSSVVLSCEKCGNSSNTCVTHRNLQYEYQGKTFYVPKKLGFCLACDAFRPMEDSEATEKFTEKLAELSERLLTVSLLPPLQRLRKKLTFEYRFLKSDMRDALFSLCIAGKRSGDERCLVCLSSDVVSFNRRVSPESSIPGVIAGRSRTGFLHPGCGGEFIAELSEYRFALSREPVFFHISVNGEINAADS